LQVTHVVLLTELLDDPRAQQLRSRRRLVQSNGGFHG
jgi:hypothetical protein